MLADLRLAVRALRGAPTFAVTTVLTLALGIGATTAVFTLVNAILLNPMGVHDPGSLVAIRVGYLRDSHLANINTSVPDVGTARARTDLFTHVATMQSGDFNYTAGDRPERLVGTRVSAQWFRAFGATPALGRDFRPEDDVPGSEQVVVLSHALWQRLFGGARDVVGTTIPLNQQPYKVVGVMGREFRFPSRAELWVPIAHPPEAFDERNRHNQHLFTVARLARGVSVEQADTALRAAAARIVEADGGRNPGQWTIFARPLIDQVAGPLRTPLVVVLSAVVCVLLIACSNIAGLLLARAAGRVRDMTIRTALGAERWRIVRQSLVESGLLAALGGAAGIGLAYLGVRGLLWMAPDRAGMPTAVSLDRHVLVMSGLATLVAAAWCGIVPAWQVSRAGTFVALKDGGRSGTAGKPRQRARGALVVGQVALALVLLVGAGLFVRSLANLHRVDTGFEPRGVTSALYTLPASQYSDRAKQAAFHRTVVQALSQAPGVTRAGGVFPLPFTGNNSSGSFNIEGRAVAPGESSPHGDSRYVTPGYFEAMAIPVVKGRVFTDADRMDTEPVIVIDDLLARTYFGNSDPIGQVIVRGGASQPVRRRIIGVVAHVRHTDLAADDKGAYFASAYQSPLPMLALVVRGNPAAARHAIVEAVRAADPNQPVFDLRSMDARVSESLGSLRFAVRLLGGFALFALLMSALGLYGLISYSVAQRTAEFGIRLALGAPRENVLRLVLREGVWLLAAGIGLGAAAAYGVATLVAHQLFGVAPFDPLTFGATAAVLAAVALLAAYVPARRATGVDPVVALRCE